MEVLKYHPPYLVALLQPHGALEIGCRSERSLKRAAVTKRAAAEGENMDREYESQEHPMYVLSIEAVLTLGRFPSHEEALAQGLLVQWVKGMVTIFVSHTWLSKGHPDNEANEKLLLLKAFLRGAGTRDIHADYTVETMMGTELRIPAKRAAEIAYVFFDYCSVPRVPGPNRFAAIRSIPAYVTNASFVACVAGSWVHAESGAPHDLAAWATRGWCRLEVPALQGEGS